MYNDLLKQKTKLNYIHPQLQNVMNGNHLVESLQN